MKVALVHHAFSQTGGTERFGLDLARALVDLGDEVHLIGHTLDRPVEGAFFQRVALWSGVRPAKLLSFMHSSARCIQQEASSGAPFDCVLGLGRTLEQDVLRVGGGCHAAYLEAVEGWRDGSPPFPLAPHLSHRLALEVERRQMALTRTRRVIAVSHRVKQELLTRYDMPEDAVVVVHNGVDLERFDPARWPEARSEIRLEHGLPADALVVLFVGNGLVRKGYFTLLEAFSGFVEETRRRGIDVPLGLLVVSRDALRHCRSVEPFRRRLGPLGARVVLAGGQLEVARYYAAADLLALPTRYEPFGNVCLEAMAMGLPVLTTQVNGASELLEGNAAELLLTDPGDAAALTRGLLSLLDADRRQHMGALNRAVALRHPTGRNAQKVREVLVREDVTRVGRSLETALSRSSPERGHGR